MNSLSRISLMLPGRSALAALTAAVGLLAGCASDEAAAPAAPDPSKTRVEATTGSRIPKSSVAPVQTASGVYAPSGTTRPGSN